MRRLGIGVACCGLARLAAACGGHEDVTPMIAVQPGAAARAMALMGSGGPNYPAARAKETDAGPAAAATEPPGTLAFSCMEERGAIRALARVPCAISFAPVASSSPDDDPEDLVSANGKVAVALPAGTYRVTVSRGPEYARTTFDAEVRAGKLTWGPNEGAAVLHRVVDTRGYLAADLHELTGDDARDTLSDDAASGIEVVVGDVAPLVQAAKLEDSLVPLDRFELDAVDGLNDGGALLARLASKRPATAVASPPARTYVRVADDVLPSTWSPAREADFLRSLRDRRDVVLTTGPFLRVTANGAPIGGLARPLPDRSVEVDVHVECAPWLAVDRVSIARASGAPVEPRAVTLRPLPSGARAADAVFRLEAPADDAFVVRADGSAAESSSVATSGPIWIDADGDGESLGRTAPAKAPQNPVAGASRAP